MTMVLPCIHGTGLIVEVDYAYFKERTVIDELVRYVENYNGYYNSYETL